MESCYEQTVAFSALAHVTNSSCHECLRPPDPTPLLSPIFGILSEDWIRDFIFTRDPIQVQHFSSPSIEYSSFACSFAVIFSNLITLQPTPQPPTNFLFSPIFTVNRKTVGVGVVEGIQNLEDFWFPKKLLLSAPHCLNFRFLSDEKNNLLFMIFVDPNDNSVLIFYSKGNTACKFLNFTGLFSQDFLNYTSKKSFNSAALQQSLLFFQEENSQRTCPICRSGAQQNCGCLFPSFSPAHPFDGQFFSASMDLRLGDFESVANKIILADGKQTEHAVLESSVKLCRINDSTLVKRLSSWSVSEYMQKSLHPCSSVTTTDYGNIVLNGIRIRTDEIIPNRGVWSSDNETKLLTQSGNEGDWFESSLKGSQNQYMTCHSANDWVHNMNYEEQTAKASSRPLGIQERCDEIDFNDGITAEQTSWNQNVAKVDPVQHSLLSQTTCATLEGSGISSILSDSAIRHISQTHKELDVKELLRQIRSERRKERNRASARRSNQKRKERRELISRELDTCLEKIEVLREKELSLRKENLLLRRIFEKK